MSIFGRELSARRVGLIGWSAGIALFMWTSMIKYETIAVDPDATTALIAGMPDSIKTVFGMNGLDIATLPGYFGVCFLFVAIMLAVHAALLGSGLLTVEPLNKTTEFLYTKPVSRRRIVTQKLLSGLVQLVVIWTVTYAASWGSIVLYDTMDGFEGMLTVFMIAAALLQLTCFCIGMAAAATVRSADRAGKLLSGFVFGSYVLMLISQFEGWGWLEAFSIFRYFDAVRILDTGTLHAPYVIVCLTVSAISLAVVYLYYPRRDLTS